MRLGKLVQVTTRLQFFVSRNIKCLTTHCTILTNMDEESSESFHDKN